MSESLEIGKCNSENKDVIQASSEVVAASARYSASMDERAMARYLRVLHEIKLSPKKSDKQ